MQKLRSKNLKGKNYKAVYFRLSGNDNACNLILSQNVKESQIVEIFFAKFNLIYSQTRL